MNQRIRELAEQARKEVRAEWDKGDKHPYPEAHYAFRDDIDVRFAELIVRECMELGDTALQKGNWPGDAIKKHFEIKY